MLEIDLSAENWPADTDWQRLAERVVAAAFAVSSHGDLAEAPFTLSISIALSDNDEVQALNAKWRGKDKPTNVLSFPMLDGEELAQLTHLRHSREGGNPSPEPSGKMEAEGMGPRFRGDDEELGEILLGDLILAHGICAEEAQEKGIPLAHHVTHLIVHGTLHLLGFDHIDDLQAEHMEALEVIALASLGLGNPYSDH